MIDHQHWLNIKTSPSYQAAFIFIFHSNKILLLRNRSLNPPLGNECLVPTLMYQNTGHSLRDQVLQYLASNLLQPDDVKYLQFMDFAFLDPHGLWNHNRTKRAPFVVLSIDRRPQHTDGNEFVWRTEAECGAFVQPGDRDNLPVTNTYSLVLTATLHMYLDCQKSALIKTFGPYFGGLGRFCDDTLLSIIRARRVSLGRGGYGNGSISTTHRNNKECIELDMEILRPDNISGTANAGTVTGSWKDDGTMNGLQTLSWENLMEEDGRLRVFWVDLDA